MQYNSLASVLLCYAGCFFVSLYSPVAAADKRAANAIADAKPFNAFKAESSLPYFVTDALEKARIPEEKVAIVVQPVGASRPLISHNADVAMNPASVIKLFPTYAGLGLLGVNYTWNTRVWSDEPPEEGRVHNIYVQGSGDPKLNLEQFWLMLRRLKINGIKNISGDLVLDRGRFVRQRQRNFDGNPLRAYNKMPDALLVSYGAQNLIFKPQEEEEDEELKISTLTPTLLRIENNVGLSKGRCGYWKNKLKLNAMRTGQHTRLEISGKYPRACGERILNLVALSGNQQVGGIFRDLWKSMGGTFKGKIRSGGKPRNGHLLLNWYSPPLSEIVYDINKYSNNVMARQLFLTLGAGKRHQGSLGKGSSRLKDWLASRGLNFPELVIENGSGLSRKARASAASVNRLLIDAWSSKVMPEFLASLPLAGVDGTMRRRLRGSSASGRARIKTGTLTGVKTMAGYAMDRNGNYVTVVFMVNHRKASAAEEAMNALLLWIAS